VKRAGIGASKTVFEASKAAVFQNAKRKSRKCFLGQDASPETMSISAAC
jgi:hypothetical protein